MLVCHTVDSHKVNPLHSLVSTAFVVPVLLAVTTCTAPTEQPVDPHSIVIHRRILAHIAVYKPVIWLNFGLRTVPSMQWYSEQPQQLSVAQERQLALYHHLSQPRQSEY